MNADLAWVALGFFSGCLLVAVTFLALARTTAKKAPFLSGPKHTFQDNTKFVRVTFMGAGGGGGGRGGSPKKTVVSDITIGGKFP